MNTPNSAHYSIKSAFIKVLATLFIINEISGSTNLGSACLALL